jgi:hypothetical protein
MHSFKTAVAADDGGIGRETRGVGNAGLKLRECGTMTIAPNQSAFGAALLRCNDGLEA